MIPVFAIVYMEGTLAEPGVDCGNNTMCFVQFNVAIVVKQKLHNAVSTGYCIIIMLYVMQCECIPCVRYRGCGLETDVALGATEFYFRL